MSNPGHYSRRVGPYVVTALNDGTLSPPSPGAVLLNIAPELAEAMLAERFRGPGLLLQLNAYLIQGEGRTILVDAGAGGMMGPTAGFMMANLAAMGVAPGDVDAVLLTHFHGDHLGGLTDAGGHAAFPRAELLYPPEEAGYWLDAGIQAAAPEAAQGSFAAVRQMADLYRGRMRAIDADAFPGITRVSLPGHTPGHSGWQIGEGADGLLIWGDVIHVPDIQAARPEVGMVFDSDAALAERTRRAVLARAAAERLPIAGMHLHFPGFVHVVQAGEGYALVAEVWAAQA